MSISAPMIVRNEARCIKRCLESIVSVVNEVILVDTGSVDETKEIAAKFNSVKIVDHPWSDSFSEARNFALSLATKNWILYIDADEWIEPTESAKISALLSEAGNSKNAISCIVKNYYANGGISEIPALRIFRRIPEIKFQGAIHNQLIIDGKWDVLKSNMVIEHDGYNLDDAAMKIKRDRSMAMMEKQFVENPNDEMVLFHYSRTAVYAREWKRAQSAALKHIDIMFKRNFVPIDHLFLGTFYTLFLASYNLGDTVKCYELMKFIVDKNPTYLDGIFALAIMSADAKRVEAKKYFDQYFDLLPKFQNSEIKINCEIMTLGHRGKAMWRWGKYLMETEVRK